MTQASNFSLSNRLALSAVMGTVSIPNCRKHSDSNCLEGSLRSTSAARAENFLEGARDESVFPKAFSLSNRRNPILALDLEHGNGAEGQSGVQRCHYRG
jgi:hypothetical protein